MKKIMFNDKYELTKAVLEGRKTQTRRVINVSNSAQIFSNTLNMHNTHTHKLQQAFKIADDWRYVTPNYCLDEVVAVAQSYNDIIQETFDKGGEFKATCQIFKSKGLTNKMFVKAELMPHHIRITNIRVERLQDISDNDCLAEGVEIWSDTRVYKEDNAVKKSIDEIVRFQGSAYTNGTWDCYNTSREAYAALIDEVSCKDTWDSNPWVFVYDFELID